MNGISSCGGIPIFRENSYCNASVELSVLEKDHDLLLHVVLRNEWEVTTAAWFTPGPA